MGWKSLAVIQTGTIQKLQCGFHPIILYAALLRAAMTRARKAAGRRVRLASPRARKAARSFAATHGRVHVPTTINIEMAPSSMFSAIKRNIG